MELPLAYAVMGLDSAATLEEAKKGYRARAVLLHPDRVEGGLRGDAEAAMSQLNEAWEVVRAHLARRGRHGRGRSTRRSSGCGDRPLGSTPGDRAPPRPVSAKCAATRRHALCGSAGSWAP